MKVLEFSAAWAWAQDPSQAVRAHSNRCSKRCKGSLTTDVTDSRNADVAHSSDPAPPRSAPSLPSTDRTRRGRSRSGNTRPAPARAAAAAAVPRPAAAAALKEVDRVPWVRCPLPQGTTRVVEFADGGCADNGGAAAFDRSARQPSPSPCKRKGATFILDRHLFPAHVHLLGSSPDQAGTDRVIP